MNKRTRRTKPGDARPWYILSVPGFVAGTVAVLVAAVLLTDSEYGFTNEMSGYFAIMVSMMAYSFGLFTVALGMRRVDEKSSFVEVFLYTMAGLFFASVSSAITFGLHLISPEDTPHNLFMYSWAPEFAIVFTVVILFYLSQSFYRTVQKHRREPR